VSLYPVHSLVTTGFKMQDRHECH